MSHSYYRFHAYLDPKHLKENWSRDRIIGEVNQAGAPCFSGSCCEVYLERAFVTPGLGPKERLPCARFLSENSLMFPVYSTLTEDDMRFIGQTAREVIQKAVRKDLKSLAIAKSK